VTGVRAVIVTYNSAGYVRRAVEACLRQELAVLVVDNASTDGTVGEIPADPRVRVVVSERNLGFAGGVNLGVREAGEELILLLNPDTELLVPIAPIVAAAVQKRHRAAAGVLVDEAGVAQKGFSFRRLPTPAALAFEVLGINRIWPGNPVNRWYRCLDADLGLGQEVEQPAGACLLFRRDDWEELGGFDEEFYPVWFEDVDYCRRFLDRGGRVWFEPKVRVLHFGGHSVQKIEFGCRQRVWYGSLLRYVAKHFGRHWRRIVAVTVVLAVVPRILFSRMGEPVRAKVHSIRFIWRLAWRCFQTGNSTESSPVGSTTNQQRRNGL
jgi:GT2 family glycosyltransferase